MHRRSRILIVLVTLSVPLLSAPQSLPARPCGAPEHRQFDFWIGDWDVRTPDGKIAGRNRIEKAEGECGLQESWSGAGGGSGRSINAYSAGDRKWHQAWLSSGGLFMHLRGEFRNGSMAMEGETSRPNGIPMAHRITWTPQPHGRVRQLWEQSNDGRKTWTIAFDGMYSRRQP